MYISRVPSYLLVPTSISTSWLCKAAANLWRMEENMYEEMRAREAIKRNIFVHGVQESNQGRTDRERVEADLVECHIGTLLDVFTSMK